MDGTRVVILSMGFFIGLIMLGFVIAAAYASMKDDAEHKEDGVKKEPKNGSDADEVLEATKVIVEANKLKPLVIWMLMKLCSGKIMKMQWYMVFIVVIIVVIVFGSVLHLTMQIRSGDEQDEDGVQEGLDYLFVKSHNKTYKGLEMSWRFPPRGWLKFNVCRVVFEDKAGGGGVLRDGGVARAFFSSPSEAKDAEFAELKSTGVALELYEGMGWATCCPLLIEVGSNVVFKWLLETESRPAKLHYFFAEIERSYLSFEKAEHMGNKMTFALAIAVVERFGYL
ncbi:hypothetical protein Golob_020825 [Gossypium lobatum]|uniref:RNase H type-1 domain-containing protein n=1 Tax=Gossypium lobatum TaxID=34289 RepID=A0A7J8LBL2_9ROSI|nr:hypothetical protein [Gossypium lobatum]